ncbi:MAG: thioredoxin [Candidatus Binatia bacterium]|nr:MAG: thioredoxin [Candidatus Binatia bacterium]
MRRWLAPVVFFAIAVAGGLWYQQYVQRTRAGFPAPDFELEDLNGQKVRLSAFRGRVVLLNVWATWCAPCREEMPSMERLHRRFSRDGLTVLAVSQDEQGRTTVEPYVRELGLTFPVLLDPRGEVARKFGVTGYPESFVIDRDGKVVLHHVGFQDWSSPPAVEFFRRLLDRSREALADRTD